MPGTEALRTKVQVLRGEGQTDYKRALGYRRLGIDPKDVHTSPFFAMQLKGIVRAFRGANNRHSTSYPARALDLLEASEDPEAAKVMRAYRSVPASYRRVMPPEAFCLAAGVTPDRVLEIVTVAAVRQRRQACTIVAALMSPHVVMKTVERALEDEGTRERAMLHKAMGFLPTQGLPACAPREAFGTGSLQADAESIDGADVQARARGV